MVCPVCGDECGYRQIKEYYRTVRELFPVRERRIPVARFQCQGIEGHHPTFSMLPHQLVPYFQHTLESMVMALFLWRELIVDPEESSSAYRASQELSGDSPVTSWTLRLWALILRDWFQRAECELSESYDFSAVQYGDQFPDIIEELFGYFSAISRGPPRRGGAVVESVRDYGAATGRFLLGVPSQGR